MWLRRRCQGERRVGAGDGEIVTHLELNQLVAVDDSGGTITREGFGVKLFERFHLGVRGGWAERSRAWQRQQSAVGRRERPGAAGSGREREGGG